MKKEKIELRILIKNLKIHQITDNDLKMMIALVCRFFTGCENISELKPLFYAQIKFLIFFN